METQVNVTAGKGEQIREGKRTYYTDQSTRWWNIRIPKNANSEPTFNDYELTWPLDEHAEGIGTTGWDWQAKRSRCVGFDFDSITGHAAGVGVTSEELAAISRTAQALPYVEVRKSTGGNGLHLRVWFDEEGIPCANHTEHAAIARCVLGMMSSETGFDFASQIDACGGNLWIWHRKMTTENGGLKLIKAAEKALSVSDLPANWKDHIEVVQRKCAKIRIAGISDEQQSAFDDLVTSCRRVPLDAKHKQIITAIADAGYSAIWVPDYHCLQTHTHALATLMEDPSLGLVGVFRTLSSGSTPINCFLFPLPNGAWRVCRFGPGVKEAETWTQDGSGWTTCCFNRQPDLRIAAIASGGVEKEGRGGFEFSEAEQALEAAALLGERISLDDKFIRRPATLRKHKDGRLIIDVRRADGDGDRELPGWTAAKDKFTKITSTQTEQPQDNATDSDWDAIVRNLKTPDGKDAGFYLRHRDSEWVAQNRSNCQAALMSLGNTKDQATEILGAAILSAWRLVNLPFQAEYPGNRQWNLLAAQLKVRPVEGPHPHWDLIFEHVGQELTPHLANLQWAQHANIRTGGDWLRAYIAIALRCPFAREPYLFLSGPQNSGKSIVGESLQFLVTAGIVKADRALNPKTQFNGELLGAIFGIVEETSINSPAALARIKDLVTGDRISIHQKFCQAYDVPNCLHIIHTANQDQDGRAAVPVTADDSRIQVVWVPAFKGKEIPKRELFKLLEAEAPAFLYTLLHLTLPTPEGRLAIPIVETAERHRLRTASAPLLTFAGDCIAAKDDGREPKAAVYVRYRAWAEQSQETEILDPTPFGRELRKALPALRDGKMIMGNKRVDCYVGITLT